MAAPDQTAPGRRRRLSPSLVRTLPWLAGAVLLAGIAAILSTTVFNERGIDRTPLAAEPAAVLKKEKQIQLPREARAAAGRFIQTAVMRRHLAEAWTLADPTLKQGYTLKEWLTGTIPVVPFSRKYFDKALLKVDYAYRDRALLEVAMLSKNDKQLKSQYFFLELRRRGGRWLVSSWSPRGAPKIPLPAN